jgi:hypothetical protein
MEADPDLPSAGVNRFRFNGFACGVSARNNGPMHPEVRRNITPAQQKTRGAKML